MATRFSRRRLLATSAAASAALALPLSGSRGVLAAQERNSVVWISPRGSLEVLDDYGYWVGKKMGYFGDLQTELQPGILEATSGGKAVAEGQADMSFVSPGVFSALLEAGTPLVSVWHQVAQDTFDFAVPKGSGITEVAQLEGKKVALGDPGWSLITDPMFAQAGVDPASIQYIPAGATWAQAVDQGQADAALTWEGLRAQWGATGLEYDYILGKDWSKFPSNSFQIRKEDFEDSALADLYTRYLRGWAMGMEFSYWNPRAATEITMNEPTISQALNETFQDKAVAVESMWENALIFRGDFANREGWGWHDMASWQGYFDTIHDLGQITKAIKAEDVCKNDYIAGANDFDVEQVKEDARTYALSPEYAAVPVPEGAGFSQADLEGSPAASPAA
ncbi:MAG TPA: ABC transporter substrate-binding protein [Thermomicrobiales bacterium]|nr:ABC transporter substrate-binding protein [Thermomicrobiales bacterium]